MFVFLNVTFDFFRIDLLNFYFFVKVLRNSSLKLLCDWKLDSLTCKKFCQLSHLLAEDQFLLIIIEFCIIWMVYMGINENNFCFRFYFSHDWKFVYDLLNLILKLLSLDFKTWIITRIRIFIFSEFFTFFPHGKCHFIKFLFCDNENHLTESKRTVYRQTHSKTCLDHSVDCCVLTAYYNRSHWFCLCHLKHCLEVFNVSAFRITNTSCVK